MRVDNVLVLGAAALVVSCGGGGNGCEHTGASFAAYYLPRQAHSSLNEPSVLSYRLGQAQQWELHVDGVTSACLSGMKAEPDLAHPLPPEIQLDAATGRLSTGGLTRHVEGTCVSQVGQGSMVFSKNRVCQPGEFVSEVLSVVRITAPRIEGVTSALVAFTPAP